MNVTTDQLSYILERKYQGIRIGIDVVINGTITEDVAEPFGIRNEKDARIAQWNIAKIPRPTERELENTWSVLEEQYDADATRTDSKMYKFVYFRDWVPQDIKVNEEL